MKSSCALPSPSPGGWLGPPARRRGPGSPPVAGRARGGAAGEEESLTAQAPLRLVASVEALVVGTRRARPHSSGAQQHNATVRTDPSPVPFRPPLQPLSPLPSLPALPLPLHLAQHPAWHMSAILRLSVTLLLSLTRNLLLRVHYPVSVPPSGPRPPTWQLSASRCRAACPAATAHFIMAMDWGCE